MLLRILGLFWGLGLLSIASALSASGNKLLVVLEEDGDKSKYSHFWSDLQGEQQQLQLHRCSYTAVHVY